MNRLLLAAPLLLLCGCSNAGSVPEPHARAMLISACQAAATLQCAEGYMAAPGSALPHGERAEVQVPVDRMQCPEGHVAVQACPQADRIGVCDLPAPDGGGVLRFHIYRGGESALADCERNDALRVYRL